MNKEMKEYLKRYMLKNRIMQHDEGLEIDGIKYYVQNLYISPSITYRNIELSPEEIIDILVDTHGFEDVPKVLRFGEDGFAFIELINFLINEEVIP